MKTLLFLKNTMLTTGLVAVLLLRLLLWPTNRLNKALKGAAQWMLSRL